MNQYQAANEVGKAFFGDDMFEAEFTVDEEADWLGRGALVIVPRPYRVLVDNYTVDGQPVEGGAVILAGFPMEMEEAHVGAGHLERARRDAKPTVEPDDDTAEPEPSAPRRRRTTTTTKE